VAATFDWYELVEEHELQQGDFLSDCLLPVVPREQSTTSQPAEPEIIATKFGVVVLTHSCDLQNSKCRTVMVCPIFDIVAFLGSLESKAKANDLKEKLRKGSLLAYVLLERCELPGYESPHLVADFARAFSVPVEYARSLAIGPRCRLLPPYREHLAQAFARYYMRVGLPKDISPIP
jgi:hypothetical protein